MPKKSDPWLCSEDRGCEMEAGVSLFKDQQTLLSLMTKCRIVCKYKPASV